MRYIRIDDQIIDLEGKGISSYEIIGVDKAEKEYCVHEAFIMIYYYDEDKGAHLERDGKGGRSMDNYNLKDARMADTIEELCDDFIFFDTHDNNKPHLKSSADGEGIWYLGASLFKETVRGIIYTDKGLTYVAKMNKKGELEVL